MRWPALILLTLLAAGCGETSLAPAISPEALRQKAAAYRLEGKQVEAESLLTQAIGLQLVATRDQRATAADLRRELASLRMAADDLARAEQLYLEALGLLEAPPRGTDAAIVNLRTQLAGLYYRQSRLDEAARFYRSVLALEITSLGADHPDALGTMSILGGLELKRSNFAEAEAHFRRQLTGVQKLHGVEKRESAAILDNLAEVLEKAGQAVPAAKLREEAQRIRRKLCDEC
jgi:hypothetical protein